MAHQTTPTPTPLITWDKKKKPIPLELINNRCALASTLNQGLFEIVNLLAPFSFSELFLTPLHTRDQIKAGEVCVSGGMRLRLLQFPCSFQPPSVALHPGTPYVG